MTDASRILILFAHPAFEKSRINKALVESVRGLPGIFVHDLYEAYPDFHVDVTREQKLLVEHDLIVFQHPFYWYSAPALLKEWQDLVLQHGFAYGGEGTALRGKRLLSAISTGGSAAAYGPEGINRHPIGAFLTPFAQTAGLCGMRYLPPFVVHGTHRLREAAQVARCGRGYRLLLEALRDGAIDESALASATYLNDLLHNLDSPGE